MSGLAFRRKRKTRTATDFGERCDSAMSAEILTAPLENVGAGAAGGNAVRRRRVVMVFIEFW